MGGTTPYDGPNADYQILLNGYKYDLLSVHPSPTLHRLVIEGLYVVLIRRKEKKRLGFVRKRSLLFLRSQWQSVKLKNLLVLLVISLFYLRGKRNPRGALQFATEWV